MVKQSHYDVVENFYTQNEEDFEKYFNILSPVINIPAEILKNTIKRVLVGSLTGKQKKYIHKRDGIFDFVLSCMMLGYLFVLSFVGCTKKEENNYDVLLEEWGGKAYDGFYKSLHKNISEFSVKIFSITNKKESISKKVSNEDILYVRNRYVFSKAAARKLFFIQVKYFFQILRLGKKSKINFVKLTLLIYRYILLYETDTININAKVLVSAGDNYYNGLRYYIYKKNGIENILLIQNGYRDGKNSVSSGDMYSYSDYYFGFGVKSIESQPQMNTTYKIPIGSIRLYNAIKDYSDIKEEYDVVFVDGYANIKTDNYNVNTYRKIVENLVKFKKEMKDIKVLFRTNPGRVTTNDYYIVQRDLQLRESGIIFDDFISKNTYEAVSRSKVVLFYRTTVGLEALALNKKVLMCNYDKKAHFYSDKEDIGCLVDASYKSFKEKVLGLLNDNSNEVNLYYSNLKKDYMDLSEDPSLSISNRVKEIING